MRDGDVSTPKVGAAGATGAAGSAAGVNKTAKSSDVKTVKMVDDNAEERAAANKAQTDAANAVRASIQSGDAAYYIGMFSDDVDITTGDMKLRDIEKKFNLPQGTLNSEKTEINGYYATQTPANGMVTISAKTLAKSMGIDVDDLKKMFPTEQQYTWKDAAKEIWNRIKSNI